MLDEDLLRDYCEGFFGYGNPKGTFWFIGLEERGGQCEEVVRNRLTLWHRHFKRAEIIDCRDFHCRLIGCEGRSLCDLFQDPPRHQPTWNKLCRVQLAFNNDRPITKTDVHHFRLHRWGQSSSENCLLELLPLPCPRRDKADWRYCDWIKGRAGSWFSSRTEYEDATIPYRVKHLRDLIEEHAPTVVVFYSTAQGVLPLWTAIAGPDWRIANSKYRQKYGPYKRYFQCRGSTLFVVMAHPNDCRRNAYFDWVGKEIKTRLRR